MSGGVVRGLRGQARKSPGIAQGRLRQAAQDLEQAEANFLDQATALLTDRSAGIRTDERLAKALCEALAALGAPRAVPALCDLLDDRTLDSSLRAEVARTLGRLRVKSSAQDLIREVLHDNEDEWVRTRAIDGLASLGTARGDRVLLTFAQNEAHPPRLRHHALSGLGQSSVDKTNAAVLALARQLCTAEDADVAVGALFALAKRGDGRGPTNAPGPGGARSYVPAVTLVGCWGSPRRDSRYRTPRRPGRP